MARYPKGFKLNPEVSKTNTVTGGKILMTSSNTTQVPGQPYERSPYIPTAYKWQPFGHDNMFPQAIAQLTRKSPTHRGIINWKNKYISGSGFKTKNPELLKFVNECNGKMQSLQLVTSMISFDKISSGNAYLEIVFHPKTKVVNFYHRDHSTCRISKDGLNVLIYGDWQNIQSAKPENISSIPLYPSFIDNGDGYQRSIFHLKDYEPEFFYYGVPSWVAAMDAAAIAYKTNKWNVSRLDNDFASSGTLVMEGNISPKEAKELKKDFKATYTGEGKTGKVFFVVKQLGGGKTEFLPTNKISDGDWLSLHKQSTEDLLIAHTWFPSLSGMVSSGGLGGNIQQIRTEYQIALSQVIEPEQFTILQVYKKILAFTSGIDTSDFIFTNKTPVDMYDLDINSIMKVGEARRLKGLIVDENDPKMDLYITEIKPTKTATTSITPGAND